VVGPLGSCGSRLFGSYFASFPCFLWKFPADLLGARRVRPFWVTLPPLSLLFLRRPISSDRYRRSCPTSKLSVLSDRQASFFSELRLRAHGLSWRLRKNSAHDFAFRRDPSLVFASPFPTFFIFSSCILVMRCRCWDQTHGWPLRGGM